MLRTRSSTTVWQLARITALGVVAVLCGCAAHRPSVHHGVDPYLQHLIGEWDTTRTMDDKVVANIMRAESVLEGKFVQVHLRCLVPDDPYEAIVLVGRADDRGNFVAHWCDTFGAGYSEVGRGTLVGNTIEFCFKYPSGPFYNTWKYDPELDEWTFTGESQGAGGSRVFFARDVIRRRR